MSPVRLLRRQRGVTLLELIVAIVLLGMLAAVGTNMISDTMRTSYYATENHSSGSQARFAAERIAREIREMAYGASGYTITAKSATSLAFTKADGTAVTLTCASGCTAATNTVTVTYATTTATLAEHVAANGFALAYLDLDGLVTTVNNDMRFVQITLSLQNTKTGMTDSIRTRVFLRNAMATPT